MKAVILAGGLGTRLSEETHLKPKPMVEIGGKPILWHIMKIYSSYGINEFIICCGYKGYVIKEYFDRYFIHNSDVTFYLNEDKYTKVHQRKCEPWKVTLVDTGDKSQTGGRLLRVKDFLDDECFCFTYGDGVSNVDLEKLISSHKNNKTLATLTAVQPPGRFGALEIKGSKVSGFKEKPSGDNSWINGGFFVLEKEVINLIKNDSTNWEEEILPKLAKEHQLSVYKHNGFWHPMDTLRDKNYLEKLWREDATPWKIWKN